MVTRRGLEFIFKSFLKSLKYGIDTILRHFWYLLIFLL
jgi:hypothetical protein